MYPPTPKPQGLKARPISPSPNTLRVPHPSQFHREGWESGTRSATPKTAPKPPVNAKRQRRAPYQHGVKPHVLSGPKPPRAEGPPYIPPAKNPRVPHPSQSHRDGWESRTPPRKKLPPNLSSPRSLPSSKIRGAKCTKQTPSSPKINSENWQFSSTQFATIK
jgi:hypothetical protein